MWGFFCHWLTQHLNPGVEVQSHTMNLRPCTKLITLSLSTVSQDHEQIVSSYRTPCISFLNPGSQVTQTVSFGWNDLILPPSDSPACLPSSWDCKKSPPSMNLENFMSKKRKKCTPDIVFFFYDNSGGWGVFYFWWPISFLSLWA